MQAPALPTELVPPGHVARGTGRTHHPAPERVADVARSIAHCGLVVPLLAERRGTTYHVHSGHIRLAAPLPPPSSGSALKYTPADGCGMR